jgi:hypothetical protein
MDGMSNDPWADDFDEGATGASDPSAVRDASRPSAPAEDSERRLARLGLPESANELLAMLTFLTAADGPLQQLAESGRLDARNDEVLVRMRPRIDVIGDFLRARIAALVDGQPQGAGTFAAEIALAGANLDTSRALATVVERVLTREAPTDEEFDLLADEALGIYAALEALQSSDTDGSR